MKLFPFTAKRFVRVFRMGCLMAGFLSAMVVHAQNQAAQVSGQITDPSGSVIPNATVEILNKDTGVSRQTVSNSDGYYVLPLLQPGK